MPLAVVEIEQPDIEMGGGNQALGQFTRPKGMHNLHALLGQQLQQFVTAFVAAANQPDAERLGFH